MTITFDASPLNEVVVGRTFLPRSDFLLPYYGAFWRLIESNFPKVAHANPIIGPNDVPLDPNGAFLPRVWLSSADDTRLVQLQQNRFHFNWRQTPDNSASYIRFPAFRTEAMAMWQKFSDFVQEMTAVELQPTASELTYINLLDPVQEDVYAFAERALKIFAASGDRQRLPSPKLFNVTYFYPVSSDIGDLQITAATGLRTDGSAVIKLELTIRSTTSEHSFEDWMTAAHDFVVPAFKDITTSAMHQLWRLKEE